jgi:hypothetical protein
MSTVRLTHSLQWLAAQQTDLETDDFFDTEIDLTALEAPASVFPHVYTIDIGRVVRDFEVLVVPDEQRDALWDAYRSPQRGGIQHQAGIQRAVRQAFSVVHDKGQWGEVVNRQRVYRPVQVIGLSCPDIANASTEASFSFAKGAEQGLKITLGVASLGRTKTYTLNYELKLECAPGEAKIGCLYVPLDYVTQKYRPPASAEWFDRDRYEPIELDPKAPNIGARADDVSPDELLERASPTDTPYGGGSSAQKGTIKKDQGISIAMEIGPKFKNAAGSLTVSAKVEAHVSISIGYSLPANSAFNLFWLDPIAGVCAVKS